MDRGKRGKGVPQCVYGMSDPFTHKHGRLAAQQQGTQSSNIARKHIARTARNTCKHKVMYISVTGVVAQAHARDGLAHAHDALDVPHRDGHAAAAHALAAQIGVEARDLVLVDVAQRGARRAARVQDVPVV